MENASDVGRRDTSAGTVPTSLMILLIFETPQSMNLMETTMALYSINKAQQSHKQPQATTIRFEHSQTNQTSSKSKQP